MMQKAMRMLLIRDIWLICHLLFYFSENNRMFLDAFVDNAFLVCSKVQFVRIKLGSLARCISFLLSFVLGSRLASSLSGSPDDPDP